MNELDALLVRAARSLYGDQWQSPIARDLQMSDRHIRRIAAGQASARPGMLVDMWRLIIERQLEMDEIIDEIRQHAATQDVPERPAE